MNNLIKNGRVVDQSINRALDGQVIAATATARMVCDRRAGLTGDPKLRFDSLTHAEQVLAVNRAIVVANINLLVPSSLRADAVRFKSEYLAGQPVRLGSRIQQLRADAAGSAGGAGSDLDTVFRYEEIAEGIIAPNQGRLFIPQRSDMSNGAVAVLHRRLYEMGEHLPIDSAGGGMGSLDYQVQLGLTQMHWYGSMGQYTMMQSAEGGFQGVDPSSALNVSARRVVERATDKICWVGDATTGLSGVLNYPGTAVLIGATLDLSDVDSVVNGILAQVKIIETQSNDAMSPNVIGVSPAIMGALIKSRSGVSQLGIEALLAGLQRGRSDRKYRVEQASRLSAAGPGSQDGILYMDDQYGEDGLHQIVLGPYIIPVANGYQTQLFVVTKQGGVSQHREHAATIAWHAIQGA